VYRVDVTIYQKCSYSLLNELIGYLSVEMFVGMLKSSLKDDQVASHSSPG